MLVDQDFLQILHVLEVPVINLAVNQPGIIDKLGDVIVDRGSFQLSGTEGLENVQDCISGYPFGDVHCAVAERLEFFHKLRLCVAILETRGVNIDTELVSEILVVFGISRELCKFLEDHVEMLFAVTFIKADNPSELREHTRVGEVVEESLIFAADALHDQVGKGWDLLVESENNIQKVFVQVGLLERLNVVGILQLFLVESQDLLKVVTAHVPRA